MKEDRLHYLLEQVSNDAATASEREELRHFIMESPDPELFSAVVSRQLADYSESASDHALFIEYTDIAEKVLQVQQQVSDEQQTSVVRRLQPFARWWAAASILLLIIGGYWWFQNGHQQKTSSDSVANTDIAAGSDGAILTLSDGTVLQLDSLQKGEIAMQEGTSISLKEGQLIYQPSGNTGVAVVYNTMHTPRGRQFQLMLPDGTKVWMNAASSIKYPTRFDGKERLVEVTGELFFEVSRNTRQPFRVKAAGKTEIEVLGTTFNVNAYRNEDALAVTLVEGSVRCNMIGEENNKNRLFNSVILKPGQQASIGNCADCYSFTVDKKPDLPGILAWRKGVFNFENASLEEVMRQLERWYDIEVIYEGAKPALHFVGKLSREKSLRSIINALDDTDVHFKLEGRKLTVLP